MGKTECNPYKRDSRVYRLFEKEKIMEVLLATSCVGLILGVIGFILNDIMPDDEYFEENERR